MKKGIGILQGRVQAVRLAALCLGFGVLALLAGVRAQDQTGEKKETPFVCNIKTLSVGERAHKKQIGEKMAASQVETKELPNGYAYRYRQGGVSLVELADWVETSGDAAPSLTWPSKRNEKAAPCG